MPRTDTEVLAVQNAQREDAQRRVRTATFEMFKAKKPAHREFPVVLDEDEDPVRMVLEGIGRVEYDELVGQHPATVQQKAGGDTFDVDSFAPQLLSRVVKEPHFTVTQWEELLGAKNWGRGEIMSIFWACDQLCNRSLDLAPFAKG